MESDLTGSDLDEIREALKLGSRLLAVRIYREKTGAGLAGATQFIDGLLERVRSTLQPSPELLERAVLLATRQIDGGAAAQEQAQLAKQYSEAQLISAFDQARVLCNQAFILCERCHDGKLAYDDVLAQLEQTCPGFTPPAYEAARSSAMRDSR